MAELVWRGKGATGAVRPLETPITEELHGPVTAGGWHNRLIRGEASRVLPALSGELRGCVALVYIDPPFETGSRFMFQARVPGAADGAARLAVPAYEDARGVDDWLAAFHEAALSLHALLKDGGSLYVHLDEHVSHYAKVVLDEVFGAAAFQREIVWRIGWLSGFKTRAKNWIRNHDVILFYAKGGRRSPGFTFHKEHLPYPEGYVRRDGRPPRGPGYPLEDVWNASELDRMDSIQIMSFSGEKVGYPTQKNENLLARIIRASSSPGDLVLDGFVGSGTTAVVAEKLGRRWIAVDASAAAIHATRKRLLGLPEEAGLKPFSVERLRGGGDGERADAADANGARSLRAEVRMAGERCTLALRSFEMPRAEALPAGAHVSHWSQWLEGWCVDWDHRGGALRVGSRAWRPRSTKRALPLTVSHSYPGPGRYVALVKAFDVLGGAATTQVPIEIPIEAGRGT